VCRRALAIAFDAPHVPKLLVVEDEEPVTRALADYFATLGYVVDVAANEVEAIAKIDRHEYAAVVTDLRLSCARHTGGLDVIAHLHRRDPTAVCIVLTAHGDADLEREARSLGADDYLQKPTALRELAERLTRLLDRRLTRIRT
jgi:two-component system, NtrC family, C4-dicarboxylate transport response regulator DctD